MADNTTLMSSAKDFDTDAAGWAKRWKNEYDAALKAISKWQETGDEIVRVFKAETKGAGVRPETRTAATRIPLYTGNVQTQRAMLYGEEPQAAVDNRFHDANDEQARVAGEMLERLLNDDLTHPKDTFQPVLGYALDDFQLPGAGVMRWRYEATFGASGDEAEAEVETQQQESDEAGGEPDEGDAGEPAQVKENEHVTADYVHWRDFLWAPSRTWLDCRWVAFRAYLTMDDAKKNFGEDVAKKLPFSKGASKADGKARQEDMLKEDPWKRVEVWEIWSREHRRVFWWVDTYPEVLKVIDDPYQLDGFFPMPEPLMANLTTSGFLPRPDYALAQDLYQEFDEVSYRARRIAEAIKVRGVFDAKNKVLGRILEEAFDQDMIPHENWGQFSKDGGIDGAIQFLPIDMLATVLEQLLAYRMQLKQLLDEVTGNGDVMRGAAASVGEEQTATETRSQVRFGSVRLKAKQKRFERFASEALAVKAEIIVKHYSPETIVECSNIQNTPDAQQVPQALQLLKDKFWFYRIAVKPNSVSLRDMDAVKTERVQLLEALSQFLTGFGPVMQQAPPLAPMCMQLLKATLAGFEASKELEGIIEGGIQAWTQAQQQQAQQGPPPDPKLIATQMKAQADMQKEQVKSQLDQQQAAQDHSQRLQEIQAELQADITRQEAQAHWNIQEEIAKGSMEAHANAVARDADHQNQLHLAGLKQSAPLQRPPKGNGKK